MRRADLLRAYAAVGRLQENPYLGEFRVRAAQIGIHLSPRWLRRRQRILAVNRGLYELEKPKGPAKEKRALPFRAERRHQFWMADVRYVDDHRLEAALWLREKTLTVEYAGEPLSRYAVEFLPGTEKPRAPARPAGRADNVTVGRRGQHRERFGEWLLKGLVRGAIGSPSP